MKNFRLETVRGSKNLNHKKTLKSKNFFLVIIKNTNFNFNHLQYKAKQLQEVWSDSLRWNNSFVIRYGIKDFSASVFTGVE